MLGARPAMKSGLGSIRIAIEQVLESLADAHIARREVAKDSPKFHILSGAIAAYGKTLALLTALQQREVVEYSQAGGAGERDQPAAGDEAGAVARTAGVAN